MLILWWIHRVHLSVFSSSSAEGEGDGMRRHACQFLFTTLIYHERLRFMNLLPAAQKTYQIYSDADMCSSPPSASLKQGRCG